RCMVVSLIGGAAGRRSALAGAPPGPHSPIGRGGRLKIGTVRVRVPVGARAAGSRAGPVVGHNGPMTSSVDDTSLPNEHREQLAARLDDVLARIDAAAGRVGRDGRGITVLLATKMRTPAEIAVAVELLRERDRRIA